MRLGYVSSYRKSRLQKGLRDHAKLLLNNSSIILPIRLFPGGGPSAGGKRMKSKSIENRLRFWRKSLPSFAANMTIAIVNIRKGQSASLTNQQVAEQDQG